MTSYMNYKKKTLMAVDPVQGVEEETPILWLPPTYRNIDHPDLHTNFYESPSILHRYSFIFYSCVLISSGNEIGPVTNSEVYNPYPGLARFDVRDTRADSHRGYPRKHL